MLLRFKDGPASDQEIHLSVPPGNKRWFCEMVGTRVTWWAVDEEPPSDDSLKVTAYSLIESVTDEDHGIIHTYAVAR